MKKRWVVILALFLASCAPAEPAESTATLPAAPAPTETETPQPTETQPPTDTVEVLPTLIVQPLVEAAPLFNITPTPAFGFTGNYSTSVDEPMSCLLNIIQTRVDEAVFEIFCNMTYSPYNSGYMQDSMVLDGQVARSETEEYGGLCQLTFTFEARQVTVEQIGDSFECGFGNRVYAGGVYTVVDSSPPIIGCWINGNPCMIGIEAPFPTPFLAATPIVTPVEESLEGYSFSREGDTLTIEDTSSGEIIFSVNLLAFYEESDSEAVEYLRIGLSNPVWSPDGRYLAFVGAIFGPTLDLYVYDTYAESMRWLTAGPDHAGHLSWSPNSEWIVHTSRGNIGGICPDNSVWAAKSDGTAVRYLFEPSRGFEHEYWISSTQFFFFDKCSKYDGMYMVDLDRNLIYTIFEVERGDLSNHAFDPESGAMVFYPILLDYDHPVFSEEGFYMITPEQLTPRFIPEIAGGPRVFWMEKFGMFRFEQRCKDDFSLFSGITPEGEVKCVTLEE